MSMQLQLATQHPSVCLYACAAQVSKRGLMGFCDPAPDEEKHLRVRFLWHTRPYTASIADKVLLPLLSLLHAATGSSVSECATASEQLNTEKVTDVGHHLASNHARSQGKLSVHPGLDGALGVSSPL